MQDPAGEWTRLTRLYGDKSDEELLALAEEFADLTEIAQGVLRDEMRKRKLEGPTERQPEQRPIFGWRHAASAEHSEQADPDSSEDDPPDSAEYTWKTLLCECDEREQARQFAEVLRRAGIDHWLEEPRPDSIDLRTPRVIVAADQLHEARAIIAKPIPQDVIDQIREQSEDSARDFEPPVCSKCGAEDPLLESVEPANTWFCENCGARWCDPMPVENEGRNSA